MSTGLPDLPWLDVLSQRFALAVKPPCQRLAPPSLPPSPPAFPVSLPDRCLQDGAAPSTQGLQEPQQIYPKAPIPNRE